MDNIERNNQVRYELYTRKIGGIIIQEPKGWENDTRSYERDNIKPMLILNFTGMPPNI